MAFKFVKDSNDFLKEHIESSTDNNLPIVLARLVQASVFDSVRQINNLEGLANIGNEFAAWQLDFADANWRLISRAGKRSAKTKDWVDALLADKGIGALNCRVNQFADLQIPASISLTPFVAARSLIKNEAHLGKTEESPTVLADLAADLSNLWFTPVSLSSDGCDSSELPNLTEDKALAKLIRPLRDIRANEKPTVVTVKLFGNLGIGAMKELLPDASISRVMDLAWNGSKTPKGSGVVNFLKVATLGKSVEPLSLLTLVETTPITATAIVEEMSSPTDPTAKLLRILSGNVSQQDLLPPDQLLGAGRAYAIPNSLLAVLGEVRKGMQPNLSPLTRYEIDDEWGYLNTVPFISMEGRVPQVDGEAEYAEGMQGMIDMALQANIDDVGAQGLDSFRKMQVAGVDIERLGITDIAP